MILTCVRHGQTQWNAAGRFQGQTDVPLDDAGLRQAASTAERLHGERFDAAVASDLTRAATTARIVIGARDVPLSLESRWREMSFGDWEGLTWPEIEARFTPEARRPNVTPRSIVAPGGESFGQLCERIEDAVAAMTRMFDPNASVLIVTHAGPLHALLKVLEPAGAGEALSVKFLPASVSRFARVGGRWTIRGLNTVEGPIDAFPAGLLSPGT